MKTKQLNCEIPIKIECDVLVIGGSQSGVAAAVACKRANPSLDVHIIEQFGSLGGQSVNTMVCQWEFREYTNNKGQVLARGIGKEMIERIVAKGHSDPLFKEWLEGRGPPFKDKPDPRAFGDVYLDVEDIRLVLQEMCDEAGVKVHLFTKLLDVLPAKTPEQSESGRWVPDMVVVSGFYDVYGIKAKRYIDCSANNEFSWKLAGEEGVFIPRQVSMPMQTYAWFGGVNAEKFINAVWEHPDWWQIRYPDDKEQMLEHMRENKGIILRGGAPYIDEADDMYEGILEELEKYATPMIYYWLKPVKIRKISCEGSKTPYYDSAWAIEGPISFDLQVNEENVNTFMQNQLYAVHLLQKIHTALPGWENCYIYRTSTAPGFRQTRILNAEYLLTGEDVKGGARFPDVIGRGSGHDISRFNRKYEYGYDIPYRALVPKKIDALLVGARSIGCDPEEPQLVALNASRGISQTIIVSQAAGVATALSLEMGVQPRDVDIKKLQEKLREQDVVLDPPAEK